jgi:hypothetical protein
MKNVHLLPTEKPIKSIGDLVKDKYGDIHIFTKNDGKEYGKTTTKLNIYITSDEEIKEGDTSVLIIDGFEPMILTHHEPIEDGYLGKKIILTTDPKLIDSGVQAIDDEFLEWFVKNPSCEFVDTGFISHSGVREYKIIIPQEESKQEQKELRKKLWNVIDMIEQEESKQETLEDAAERYAEGKSSNFSFRNTHIRDFIAGANWQSKRMYGEKDFKLFARQYYREIKLDKSNLLWDDLADKCLEQFKKK